MRVSLGIKHTCTVGRYICTITIWKRAEGPVTCSADWTPSMPFRPMTASELFKYSAERAEAVRLLVEASKALGPQG